MTGFRCYLSPAGGETVRQWCLDQSPNVQAAIVAVIEALSHRTRDRWRRKPYGELRGASCRGLGEIRIEEPKGVHYRILGFFAGASADFVLLYGFAKNTDPTYASACPEAQRRRAVVEQDSTQVRDCAFTAAGGIGGPFR